MLIETKYMTLGENRGLPRLYLESARMAEAGLDTGTRFDVEYNRQEEAVFIRVMADGPRAVCRKQRGAQANPLIDLRNERLAMFGAGARVVVAVMPGRIEIKLHHHVRRERERLRRLSNEVHRGEISHGEICAGGGIMAKALNVGFADEGIRLTTRFAVEKDPKYLAQLSRNKNLIGRRTLTIEGGLQEVEQGILPQVSVLSAGLPCTGASRSGRAKNKLAFPEEHAEAGHLFVGFLRLVEATNPACVALENVLVCHIGELRGRP